MLRGVGGSLRTMGNKLVDRERGCRGCRCCRCCTNRKSMGKVRGRDLRNFAIDDGVNNGLWHLHSLAKFTLA
jgi:hypothetical protein